MSIDVEKFNRNIKAIGLFLVDDIDFKIVYAKTKIELMDSDGYKYYLNQGNLNTIYGRKTIPNKFFNGNPFTKQNINNYLNINNCHIELIGNPNTAIEDVEWLCLKHSRKINRSWNSVKSGSYSCCECSGINRDCSLDEIKEIVKSKGLELISEEYFGVNKNYKFKCFCGNTFIRRLDVVLYKDVCLCPKCNGITVNTFESVEKELEENNIILHSSEYKNNNTYLDIEYYCGFRTKRTLYGIKSSNYQCPHCNKKGYKRDTSTFYKEIYNLVGNEYTFYGRYENCDTKMKVKHNKCGHIYEVKPTNFINNGTRCPICSKSKGEENIASILSAFNIKYKCEYEFCDLKGLKGKALRFDFAVFKDDIMEFLIEYDGEFHYKAMIGEEHFKYQKEHDKRKDDYCKKHNIKLYRIPYWERDNLEYIVKDILIKEGF
jgi:hypothetical protein